MKMAKIQQTLSNVRNNYLQEHTIGALKRSVTSSIWYKTWRNNLGRALAQAVTCGPRTVETWLRSEGNRREIVIWKVTLGYFWFMVYRASRNNIKQSNAMQLGSDLYYCTFDYSTCFGRLLHPSSGAQLYMQPLAQVTLRITAFLRDRVWTQTSCAPDDGCKRSPKHVE